MTDASTEADLKKVKPRRLFDYLRGWQKGWVLDGSRFKALLASRQIGKDFTTAFDVARDLKKGGRDWLIACPSERQAKESLREVTMWLRVMGVAITNDDEVGYEIQSELDESPNYQALEIRMPNDGPRCTAVPGNPDTVRGFSANVWMNEFGQFRDAVETWSAMFPTISSSDSLRIIVTGTANGKTGKGKKFFEIVDEAVLNPDPEDPSIWSVHIVTIHDAIADGHPADVEILRKGMRDEQRFAQEFECKFLEGSFACLTESEIEATYHITASEGLDDSYWERSKFPPLYIGIDFGRKKDPTVFWTWELVGGLLVTREVLVMRAATTGEQFAAAKPRLRAARRVCHDYTGGGMGLGDLMVDEAGEWLPEKGLRGKVELCTFTAGFKRDLFPRFFLRFEDPATVLLPESAEIKDDLLAMEQTFGGGAYSYSAPRTEEGHSDRCTAAALGVRAYEMASSGPSAYSPLSSGSDAPWDDALASTSGRQFKGMERGVLI